MSSEMRWVWIAVLEKAKSRWVRLGLAVALLVFTGADSARWEQCALQPTEIFSGVTYGCERLERSEQGRGVLHWVRVELGAAGIELYVTPLDPTAVAYGWQYRLRSIGDVVEDQRLAVAINGTLFASKHSWWPRLSGDYANGGETVVSDHQATHSLLSEHTYLLWFDDDLKPHLLRSKPPKPEELRQAKWGIGGQAVGLYDGQVWPGIGREPDSRTAIGIDAEHKLLFLAVAEWASPHLVLERLAKLGARDAMLLDGGGSSAMAIGDGARGVAGGALFGGSRPVATYFGVRARRLSLAQGG